MILASVGHQQNVIPKGLKLINSSDCKACHAINEKVAGPSYKEIAKRYEEKDKQTLIRRVIKGKSGYLGRDHDGCSPSIGDSRSRRNGRLHFISR